jgi:predicted secreted protein
MYGQKSTSNSAAGSFSTGEPAQVSVGTFVIEKGARLALEIMRAAPCTCLCGPVWVTDLSLVDGEGKTIQKEPYSPSVDTVEWLGRVSFVDNNAKALPEGQYTVFVQTNIGEFSACVEVVVPERMSQLGRFSASAAVCGLELLVYRLATVEDAGARLMLRQSDRLMVELVGNATTGFQRENVLIPEFAVLEESEEAEYRPKPHPKEMVGFGGTFMFCYQAVAAGSQSFRFVYHRPWELVEPEEVVEFTVYVS